MEQFENIQPEHNKVLEDLPAKIAHFLPSPTISFTFAVVYAISFITATPLFDDGDAAWHIIAGDIIRAMGVVPDTNLWSFATPGEKWYLISWLWDLLVSSIHWIGGIEAVFISTQVIVAFIMALLAFHISKREGVSNTVIVIISILAGICFHKFVMSRPQLAGYLFTVLCHLKLHQSRDDKDFRNLLWLPPIVLLWCNMHGSFLVAFAILGAYFLEAACRRQWHWLLRLSFITMLCMLVLPLNPYGFGLYEGTMRPLHSIMNQRIEDWMPFVFGQYIGLSLWLVLFILLSSFREPKVPLADKFLCILWLVPMLMSKRHASIFILVSAPYMAMNLQYFVNYIKELPGHIARYEQSLDTPLHRLVMASLVVMVMVVSVSMIDDIRQESYVISPELDARPAFAWVREHLHGKRVLNDYNFGGIMAYESQGEFPLFVDGRAGSAYSEQFLTEYEIFELFYSSWAAVVDKYNIDAIFVLNSRPFAALYASGAKYERWKLVYRDNVASVFVRLPPPQAESK